ncbi:matrixin family metalloprotease [Halorhodospira halochloris]|uniref:matrixin family metalloprotease n=1 Tax=Halorhodospira halochloris TaxID=1052 RepID=UPI001EE8B70B|nr:matrixin family metalloprotease [Halorhodospira halochloris]
MALSLTLIGVGGSILFGIGAQTHNPCQRPLAYSITEVDARYDIDRDELGRQIAEAASLWEEAAGRSLFRRVDDNPELEIRLVYGELQGHLERQRDSHEELKQEQERHRERWDAFRERVQRFEQRWEEHEQQVTDYEQRQVSFERDVERWNRGEVERTAQARERLKSEQEELQQEAVTLNDRAAQLRNRSAQLEQRQNQLLAEQQRLNDYADRLRSQAERIQGFQAGEYEGRGREGRITVYQFRDRQELRTILAHELGHALGIGHVEGRRSVMYPTMSEANRDVDSLSRHDRAALREVCAR